MRRFFLVIILVCSSLSLLSCDPPPTCGKDHEGWVRATVLNGYDAGSSVTIHDLWTTMGHSPQCTDGWTGNPRPASGSPQETCMGNCASVSFPKYANGTWMKTEGNVSFYDSDVNIYMLSQQGSFQWACTTRFGPATLRCEAGHVR